MGHEKQVKYRLIHGDQKKINEELSPADTGQAEDNGCRETEDTFGWHGSRPPSG